MPTGHYTNVTEKRKQNDAGQQTMLILQLLATRQLKLQYD